jgi:hypothetical protein
MRILGSKVLVFAILALIASACGASLSPRADVGYPPTPATSPTVPSDWKNIETDHFSLRLPPDMKEKKIKGEGTSSWRFDSETLSLAIDFDPLGGDFTFIRDRYESKFDVRSINGENAQYLSLDLNKPNLKNWSFNADGSTKITKEDKNLFVGVFFPAKHISFVTTRVPTAPQDAETILNSISLK